ncbi:MAG: Flp pilus assembly protein CpaB [Janthinobacterium lividum]
MNVRRLTPPLLIALAVSGVCTLALSRKMTAKAVAPVATIHYIAPARQLAAGEVLRLDSLQTVNWPAEKPIAGAFSKADDLVGRAVLYPVDVNQPLTEKLVSVPGAGAGLAARIPEGMRAIALRSDEIMGVAGFLLPGSHLDVLVTYKADNSPDARTVTVLQNAEVIAAGQQVQPDPQGRPATVNVVTLLLSPSDAERAVLASTQGTIHFIMRSGSDQGRTSDNGIVLSELGGAHAASVASPLPAVGTQSRAARLDVPAEKKVLRQSTVQTISGDKQVTATFDEVAR